MITIKEIARLCDCSVATVNRALYDKQDINPLTKERIKSIAEEHGYRPHLMARSLVKGRTNTIGLVVFDIQNPFFVQVVNLVNHFLFDEDYSLHLGIMNGTPASEYEVLEQMAGMKVDGIIHVPMNTGDAYKRHLKRLHIPLVHMMNRLDDEFPFVGVDERSAMVNALRLITENRYEVLLYISPPLRYRGTRNIYTLEERLLGVKSSMGNLTLHLLDDKDYEERAVNFILESKRRVCILCSSDIFALEIMTSLRHHGRNPKRDYGIMGFDNIGVLRHIFPRLSTIAYPIEEIARTALNDIKSLIDGGATSNAILQADLIRGETV